MLFCAQHRQYHRCLIGFKSCMHLALLPHGIAPTLKPLYKLSVMQQIPFEVWEIKHLLSLLGRKIQFVSLWDEAIAVKWTNPDLCGWFSFVFNFPLIKCSLSAANTFPRSPSSNKSLQKWVSIILVVTPQLWAPCIEQFVSTQTKALFNAATIPVLTFLYLLHGNAADWMKILQSLLGAVNGGIEVLEKEHDVFILDTRILERELNDLLCSGMWHCSARGAAQRSPAWSCPLLVWRVKRQKGGHGSKESFRAWVNSFRCVKLSKNCWNDTIMHLFKCAEYVSCRRVYFYYFWGHDQFVQDIITSRIVVKEAFNFIHFSFQHLLEQECRSRNWTMETIPQPTKKSEILLRTRGCCRPSQLLFYCLHSLSCFFSRFYPKPIVENPWTLFSSRFFTILCLMM